MVLGETFFAAGCIATDLRGGGPLDVGECAASTREGPLRGVQPLTCGGGGPLYAGDGLTPRKGGVALASATSFSPHLVRALVANYNQSIAIFTVYSHNLFAY